MLTRKQHELLVFIDKHLRQTGFSPSFEEMKQALQLKSKSGIHRLISALEERGFLQRRHHRARALEVIRLPENMAPPDAPQSANVLRPDFNKSAKTTADAGVVELPLYGKIAAGLPIEALQDDSVRMPVPTFIVGPGDHYVLEIEGDSMIEAGILNGDKVVIRKGDQAQNGEIIVALVDGTEVTLKRFRRRGASIALEPANARHETRILAADRVRVQGKLVGLMRVY